MNNERVTEWKSCEGCGGLHAGQALGAPCPMRPVDICNHSLFNWRGGCSTAVEGATMTKLEERLARIEAQDFWRREDTDWLIETVRTLVDGLETVRMSSEAEYCGAARIADWAMAVVEKSAGR